MSFFFIPFLLLIILRYALWLYAMQHQRQEMYAQQAIMPRT